MTSAIREWLNLGVRWFHVFAGIMWVGQTYYFTWLDGQFGKLEKKAAANGTDSKVWMVHSGGFYTVQKQKSLGVAPEQVRWFRWEALLTWVAGLILLVLVYYLGDGLIDPDVANISKGAGVAIGVGAMIAGWIIYDLAVRSPLGNSQAAFVAFALMMTAVVAWGLMHVFSGRAAYIHLGAIFGTIMTVNVWMRILPAQRRMLAAAAAGESLMRRRERRQNCVRAQYVYGRAGGVFDVEQSLSGGDLWEPLRVGNYAGAGCRGMGSCETYPGSVSAFQHSH